MVPEELAKELFLVSYSNKTVPIDRRTFNNLNETLQKRWIKVAIFVLEKFSTPQEKEGLDNSIKPCDHVFSPETTKFGYQSCIKQGCNAVIFSKPSLNNECDHTSGGLGTCPRCGKPYEMIWKICKKCKRTPCQCEFCKPSLSIDFKEFVLAYPGFPEIFDLSHKLKLIKIYNEFCKPSLKLPEKNNLDEALKELECDSVELNQMIGWNKAIEEVKRLNKQ